jgi:release factor glutamine methyltransferase
MPSSPVPSSPDAVVARLRAAGCVFAEEEAALLLEPGPAGLEDRVARRVAGEPLEQVLGWAAFCGLRVAVEPGVFVPRRRSELMVAAAVARVRPGDVVVDLCCGSGAVGLAVATAVPGVVLHAADVDPAAVACARRNLAGVGTVHAGDLDAPLPAEVRGRVAVLTCNAPYVPTDAVALMPPEARDHEPRVALDGGADGLDVVRRVAAAAPGWLAPGGALLVETSTAQLPAATAAFAAAGLAPSVAEDDDLGATVVVGVRPPRSR